MAYLPEQELSNGVVRIQILEGKIGSKALKVRTDNNLNLSKEDAKVYLRDKFMRNA